MRFFVKMNGNFTSTFFSNHGRLVVAKANFKFITSRTNILHVALLTRNQVDDIFGFTVNWTGTKKKMFFNADATEA